MSSVAALVAQLHLGPGFAVAWLIALAFAIYVIVDMARHPGWQWKQAGSSKVLWLVLEIVFVLGLLSVLIGILYLVIVRPKLVAAERQGHTPPGWPGDSWPGGGGQWGWPTDTTPGGPPPVPGSYGAPPPGPTGGPPPYPGTPPWATGAGAEQGHGGGPPPYPGTGAAPSAPPFGWYPDPGSTHELRYWDGRSWTEHVSDGGTQATDPLPG